MEEIKNKKIEDLLTDLSIYYMEMVEGSSMILQVMEQIANAAGNSLRRELKQRNNRILKHIIALRHLTSDEPFENEQQSFQHDWSKWDDFRNDAAFFARITLLLADRTFEDPDLAEKIEKEIKENPSKGLIPDELIEKIRLR